jgi:hypothetical protein
MSRAQAQRERAKSSNAIDIMMSIAFMVLLSGMWCHTQALHTTINTLILWGNLRDRPS